MHKNWKHNWPKKKLVIVICLLRNLASNIKLESENMSQLTLWKTEMPYFLTYNLALNSPIICVYIKKKLCTTLAACHRHEKKEKTILYPESSKKMMPLMLLSSEEQCSFMATNSVLLWSCEQCCIACREAQVWHKMKFVNNEHSHAANSTSAYWCGWYHMRKYHSTLAPALLYSKTHHCRITCNVCWCTCGNANTNALYVNIKNKKKCMCLVVTISAAYEVKNALMRITAPYSFKAVTRYFF